MIGLLFLFLYFKNEFIILAFFKLRKQDFEGTEKWLRKIKKPKSALTKKQQGYYNFLKGILSSQNNMNAAEKYFKKAISLGLSMNHDLAMAKLNLAGIAFTKRRKIEAQKLLTEAQKLDKRNILTEQIKIMKNQRFHASERPRARRSAGLKPVPGDFRQLNFIRSSQIFYFLGI